MDAAKKAEITTIIRSLIHRILPEVKEPSDLLNLPSIDALHASCLEEAARRGYNLEPVMAKLPSGLTFSVTAYAHLDLATRIYVAIFTACFFTVDDKFAPGSDMSGLEMSRLLTRNGPFEDPAQETWFKLLLDTPEHYPHAPSASMIITSVTGFVNSLFLDNLMEGTKLPAAAKEYANYSRRLSGLGEGYTLLVFPPEVPIESYVFALPDIIFFLETGNDVLSFYKEELAGESVNRISLLAEAEGTTKIEALRRSVEETVQSHENILKILESHPGALKTYKAFSHGYMWFHYGLKRYRLAEL